jgi:hypothetical protein
MVGFIISKKANGLPQMGMSFGVDLILDQAQGTLHITLLKALISLRGLP